MPLRKCPSMNPSSKKPSSNGSGSWCNFALVEPSPGLSNGERIYRVTDEIPGGTRTRVEHGGKRLWAFDFNLAFDEDFGKRGKQEPGSILARRGRGVA